MDRNDRHDDTATLLVGRAERRYAADSGAPMSRDLEEAPGVDARGDPEAQGSEAKAAPQEASAFEPAGEARATPASGVAREREEGLSQESEDLASDEEEELTPEEEAELDAEEADELGADDGEELPALSRKVRRRARRTRPRSRTIAMKRLTREELRLGAVHNPPVEVPRPVTRGECQQEARPCPWVACKHHLYLDVNPETGSIKINFPDLEPWEIGETCALDIAERGGITLEEVGEIMNLTRERIRQVEVRGLMKLKEMSPSPDDLGGNIEPGEG